MHGRAPHEPPLHGQSFDGLRKEPPVRRAASQNALGAIGSPSMGMRITLNGTPWGYLANARSNSFSRASPSMVLRIIGAPAPWVGNPSVIMITLSGRGLSAFIAANAFSTLVPSCGIVLPSAASASLMAFGSLTFSHLPSVSGASAHALVLNA